MILGCAALLWWWTERPVSRPSPEQIRGEPEPGPEDPGSPEKPPPEEEPEEEPPTEPREREAPAEPVGNLALLVDDLGRSVADLETLDDLGIPLSWAVLPYESRTDEVVAWLSRGTREVLCHLPMEASNGADPGPGALTAEMAPRELADATRRALERIPIAVGVNNHMGSELTTDPRAMRAILEVLRTRELFFLDSRTSSETVGYRLAREMGIPAAERRVFLDAEMGVAGVREQFERWKEIGRERGAAIAIAHPHPATLEVLREEIPRARREGFLFVPVSFLLERSPELR